MIDIEEFKALSQKGMYSQLKKDFPPAAVGKSRARKGDLTKEYAWELEGRPLSTRTGRLDSSKPNEGGKPQADPTLTVENMQFPKEIEEVFGPLNPDLPTPAGINEMKAEAQIRLPVRNHQGLRFVVCEGDPNRDITRRETIAMDTLVKLLPTLGPKHQTAPKGVPGRRVFDPHSKNRGLIRQALKQLDWGKIMILRDDQVTKEQPQLETLSEDM